MTAGVRVRGMEFPPNWTFQATKNRVWDGELATVLSGMKYIPSFSSFMRGLLYVRAVGVRRGGRESSVLSNVEIGGTRCGVQHGRRSEELPVDLTGRGTNLGERDEIATGGRRSEMDEPGGRELELRQEIAGREGPGG